MEQIREEVLRDPFGHVLMVDDESALLTAVELLLFQSRIITSGFELGGEALHFYQSNCQYVDLVLLDYGLPDIKFYEMVAGLKNINPNVMIFLCTGRNLEKSLWQEIGVADLLSKPFHWEALEHLVVDTIKSTKTIK